MHRIRRVTRRLVDTVTPRAVVLMYHRVVDLRDYPYPIVVSPSRFRQHMEYVRDRCHPMSVIELAGALERRSLPRRAVAVTFDDGYRDNYTYAYPILEEAGVPATVFVISDHVDSESEFWWDDLDRILVSAARLPPRLSIGVRGTRYEWEMGSLENRMVARREIHWLLMQQRVDERERVLATLVEWAGLGRRGRAVNQAMTTTELRRLAQSNLVDIGAHTMNHPRLSSLSPEMQYEEIADGRRVLESIIGVPVSSFAYPFGTSDDFTEETVEIVRSAGFAAACTTEHKRIVYGSDLHRLPRYNVDDWDLETFGKCLEGFFRDEIR